MAAKRSKGVHGSDDELVASMESMALEQLEPLSPAVWHGSILLGVSESSVIAFDTSTGLLYSRQHANGLWQADPVMLYNSAGSAQVDSLPRVGFVHRSQLAWAYDCCGEFQIWNVETGALLHTVAFKLDDGTIPIPNAAMVTQFNREGDEATLTLVAAIAPASDNSLLAVHTVGTAGWSLVRAPSIVFALTIDKQHPGQIWGTCEDGIFSMNLLLPVEIRVPLVASSWRDTLLGDTSKNEDGVRYRLLAGKYSAFLDQYLDGGVPIDAGMDTIMQLTQFAFTEPVPPQFYFHAIEYNNDSFCVVSDTTVLVLQHKRLAPHIPVQNGLCACVQGHHAVILTAQKEVVLANCRTKTVSKVFVKESQDEIDSHPVTENAPVDAALCVTGEYCLVTTFTDRLHRFGVASQS